jgi:hypothetical protein
MNSTFLMKGLLAVYIIVCVLALFERNWSRSIYWFGAAILQTSVLMMK